MKKLSADSEHTIKSLLDSNSIIFSIPLNQRNYSWKKSNLEELWEDLIKLIGQQDGYHYLGVISLISNNSSKVGLSNYQIIDGQQRLTSMLLLVAALRDIYISMNDTNKALEIQKDYLLTKQTREVHDKLTVSELDHYTFSNLVNICIEKSSHKVSLKEDHEIAFKTNKGRRVISKNAHFVNADMVRAYNFMYNSIYSLIKNLDNEEKMEKLLDLEEALGNLDITLITSEDIESIFNFFNSLNNRGLKLNQMDIIRNKFLQIVSEKHNDQLKNASSIWDDLVIKLDQYDALKFFKYYYICTNYKILNKGELPHRYEQLFNDFGDYTELSNEIRKMLKYANIFIVLFGKSDIQPMDNQYEINIKMINHIGQQACHSFLMDYLYNVEDEYRRVSITSCIEKMMFRRYICNKSTKPLDGIFRSIMENANNSYYDEDIIKSIKENTPDDDEFYKNFLEREWSNSQDVCNYTLRKYEYGLCPNNNAYYTIIKDRKSVHIEHIMPQDLTEAWRKYLLINQDEDLTEGDYNKLVCSIGNLVLLEFDINTSIKRSLYSKKRNKYADSNLMQVKKLVDENKEWKIKQIVDRSEYLAKWASKTWKIE